MKVCVKFLSQIAQETRDRKNSKKYEILLVYVVVVLVPVRYEPG